MAVEIRRAGPADLQAVQEVARNAWHAAHEPIVSEESVEEFLAEYYTRDALAGLLDDERVFLVAVADSLLGFAVAGPTDDPTTYVLGRIYVDPNRWGEGVGQQLLTTVQRRARERIDTATYEYETVL